MKRTLGHSFRFVELANDVNEHMPDYVVRRLIVRLEQGAAADQRLAASSCSAWRTRRTPGTRESPRRADRATCCWKWGATSASQILHVPSPLIDNRVTQTELTVHELQAADAVALLVDHDAFDYDLIESSASYVLDTRHRMRGAAVEQL